MVVIATIILSFYVSLTNILNVSCYSRRTSKAIAVGIRKPLEKSNKREKQQLQNLSTIHLYTMCSCFMADVSLLVFIHSSFYAHWKQKQQQKMRTFLIWCVVTAWKMKSNVNVVNKKSMVSIFVSLSNFFLLRSFRLKIRVRLKIEKWYAMDFVFVLFEAEVLRLIFFNFEFFEKKACVCMQRSCEETIGNYCERGK